MRYYSVIGNSHKLVTAKSFWFISVLCKSIECGRKSLGYDQTLSTMSRKYKIKSKGSWLKYLNSLYIDALHAKKKRLNENVGNYLTNH